MRHFPIFVDLHGRDTLVVGCGQAAARKAQALASAGAGVDVVAEAPQAELLDLAAAGKIRLVQRAFAGTDVLGKALVIAAGDTEDADRVVAGAARAHGVPVNAVDRQGLSTFIMPAIVDRDPITVAISSAGTAPVLARDIRARIEALLPTNLGRLARFADSFRAAAKATRGDGTARRRFWDRVLAGPIAASVLAGDERGARERMLSVLNKRDDTAVDAGMVYLVGAGPGDPELLTLRALRLLHEADVIVHDRLIGPRVLDYARRDAERIDVGKAPGRHARTQDEINDLLVSLAQDGRTVVRLKGGDPFIFGRGGEELQHLRRHGIRVEVVPGITAATGCAAAAGIPLTRRGSAQVLTLVTAQGRDGAADLDWRALARDHQTLAVYMGAAAAGRIARELIGHGRDPRTAVTVIANGTLPDERVEAGTLAELERLVARAGGGPVLLLIGEVAQGAVSAWVETASAQRAAG